MAGVGLVLVGVSMVACLRARSTTSLPRTCDRGAGTPRRAAVAVTFVVGLLVTIDPAEPELVLRASVKPSDVTLALASGTAGVLAFGGGRSLSLVGVMIAVALAPPLAAAGLYLAHGLPGPAAGALYLFATNLVAVNLAGMATFLLQGLPPKDWRMTGGIVVAWLVVLLLFLVAITGRAVLGIAAPSLPGT